MMGRDQTSSLTTRKIDRKRVASAKPQMLMENTITWRKNFFLDFFLEQRVYLYT